MIARQIKIFIRPIDISTLDSNRTKNSFLANHTHSLRWKKILKLTILAPAPGSTVKLAICTYRCPYMKPRRMAFFVTFIYILSLIISCLKEVLQIIFAPRN